MFQLLWLLLHGANPRNTSMALHHLAAHFRPCPHLVHHGAVGHRADVEVGGKLSRQLRGLRPLHQLAQDEQLPLELVASLAGLALNQDLGCRETGAVRRLGHECTAWGGGVPQAKDRL